MKITLSDFNSVEVDSAEFKKIIEGFIKDMKPEAIIKSYKVDGNGVNVLLESGEVIEIEIDWNEFIIR